MPQAPAAGAASAALPIISLSTPVTSTSSGSSQGNHEAKGASSTPSSVGTKTSSIEAQSKRCTDRSVERASSASQEAMDTSPSQTAQEALKERRASLDRPTKNRTPITGPDKGPTSAVDGSGVEQEAFLGGRTLPSYALAVSVVASTANAVSIVGFVGHYFAHGFHFMWPGAAIPLAAAVAATVMVPLLYRLRVASVFQYIETYFSKQYLRMRFDNKVGTTACIVFFILSESWRQVPEPVLVPLVVESWRRVPEPALAPLFQEGWRGFPRRTTGAQGHNSLPPEHVGRRLRFVDSGAEPLEFDAATLRLPTSSRQVTTPPNVDFATESWPTGDAAQRRLRH
ncbi:hypothetical protein HPB51_000453 [Rhipicephalus microplus]|uniref:Transmembrane protein n=1 Tax=Rhipicephalus microplus TaxID=6941 RepID=A0A9J6EVR4_RHIMP|nr:hypothetical protein HPB51_000453 [Rhipicephalus microplus]